MGRIILVLLLLISFGVNAQTPTGFTKISSRYNWLATSADSGSIAPRYAGVPSGVRVGMPNWAGQFAVDTTNNRFYFYSGGSWRYSTAGTSGGAWSLTGNAGTTPGPIFIGTTDAKSLVFKINNVAAGMVGYTAIPDVEGGGVALGQQAMKYWVDNSIFYNNTVAIGNRASWVNVSAGESVYVGNWSGYSIINGLGRNVGIGQSAWYYNVSGGRNTGAGTFVGECLTSGNDNTAMGFGSLRAPSAGMNNNTAFGAGSLQYLTSNIASVTVTAGGTGYTSDPTITADMALGSPGISNRVPTFTIVRSAGVIISITPLDPGLGVKGTALTITGGGGTGATAAAVIQSSSFNTGIGNAAGIFQEYGIGNTFIGSEAGYGVGGNEYSQYDTYSLFVGADASRHSSIPRTTILTNANSIGVNSKAAKNNSLILGDSVAVTQVGIGTSYPHASSLLDVTSTTRGFLMPRMTGVQQAAISAPASGLMIYNTDSLAFCFYNGTAWTKISGGGGGSGVTTMAAIGAAPNANGASISGVTLTLQPASASFGGVITTVAQTFAGDKSYTGKIAIEKITEQLRIGYDASNYYSTTVGSGGAVTYNNIGAASAYNFHVAGGMVANMQNFATGLGASFGTKGDVAIGQGVVSGATAFFGNAYSYASGDYIRHTAAGTLKFFGGGTNAGADHLVINNGNIGVGVASPTAALHLKAGTTSANTAPQQFTSGPLETVIRGGTKEYNNGHYESTNALNRYADGGPIKDFITTVDNGTTLETDLYTYTTKASTLASDGEKLTFDIAGTFNDVTATAQLRFYFDGQSIGNTGALTVSAIGGWGARVLIIRTGATTIRTIVTVNTPGASTALYTTQTDVTALTLTNTNILKITGTAGGASGGTGDISAKLGTIEWKGAANN